MDLSAPLKTLVLTQVVRKLLGSSLNPLLFISHFSKTLEQLRLVSFAVLGSVDSVPPSTPIFRRLRFLTLNNCGTFSFPLMINSFPNLTHFSVVYSRQYSRTSLTRSNNIHQLQLLERAGHKLWQAIGRQTQGVAFTWTWVQGREDSFVR
ncbi:hypothetical protein C8Q75DRAFT_186722 [Abortiporus biennis]|nr:hypothetical protein C8Q75DRAFT_186722 [Abortiporus biennis]